jgi:hypothetical protein
MAGPDARTLEALDDRFWDYRGAAYEGRRQARIVIALVTHSAIVPLDSELLRAAVTCHGAELVHREQPAALADALLAEDDRTADAHGHGDRDDLGAASAAA